MVKIKANPTNKKLIKKDYLKYAFNSRGVNQMSDATFLDFTVFFSKQTNVDDLEELRTTLNARELLSDEKPKTIQEKAKLYFSLLVYLLFIGFFVFLIVCIVYGLWFWQKDKVKASICFNLLTLAIGSVLIFFAFLFLYNVVVLQYKKIMLLM
jgi:hypothetical protein